MDTGMYERIRNIEDNIARLEKMLEEQRKELAEIKGAVMQPDCVRAINNIAPQHQLDSNHAVMQPDCVRTINNIAPQHQLDSNHAVMQPDCVRAINPADYGLGADSRQRRIRDSGSMENKIGRSMGVVASVLVFISIILFVTLVYSSLTDAVKAACIFIFSFAVLAAGTLMMRRKMNIFTMSVTGCGMGAVFLSLFVTHIYFGMLNRLALYLLVMCWAALVYIFFSKKSYAFKLIGQIGITIAVLFGCWSLYRTNPVDSGWWEQYIFLFTFFIVISAFYIFVRREHSVARLAPMIILDYAAEFFLIITGSDNASVEQIPYLAAVSCAYMFYLLYTYVLLTREDDNNASGIIYLIISAYTTILSLALTDGIDLPSDGGGIFLIRLLILGGALLAEVIRRRNKSGNDVVHIVMTTALYLLLLNKTADYSLLYDMLGFGLYSFAMLGIAWYFGDRTSLMLAYATMLLFSVKGGEYLTINIIIRLLAAGLSFIHLALDKEMYHSGHKCACYLIALTSFAASFAETADRLELRFVYIIAWLYILIALANTVITHTAFADDWSCRENGKEKNFLLTAGVINLILMPWGLAMLGRSCYSWQMDAVLLVVSAGTFLTNVKLMYEKYSRTAWAGIYTGVKLSIFVCCALKAHGLDGPYVSIGWLVLAILLILAGFKWQYAYLRMYGLFLSMFAIVKLIVFDISYDNPVVRAVSFLIAGALCFIINLLYNSYARKE